jgi:DNA-binding NarL/FixJ family response regulator
MVFTNLDTPEYQMAASKAGADGYLLKDFSRVELIQSIEDILYGNQGLNQNIME